MRPRALALAAFGPFAGVEAVDFERLAEVGLFVVSGPTGAGKTSLFDGICYALYGRLAGHRQDHADVRSDHAAADRPTEVTFEFDAGGQRWRVWRHPRQLRPKRRGVGTTSAPAAARLDRWDLGGWQPVASRWDAVTARCQGLVGLDVEQFQQVVLLPQGRFQEILNARSADRQGLLRTLFRSTLYRQGQERLEAEARSAADEVRTVEERRRTYLEEGWRNLSKAAVTISGAGVVAEVPDPPTDPAGPDGEQELRHAADALAAGPASQLAQRRDRAETAAAAAAEALTRAEHVDRLVGRRAELARRAAELASLGPEIDADRAAATAARRAAPVREAAVAADRADDALADARAHRDRSWIVAVARAQAAGVALPAHPDEDAAEDARIRIELRANHLAALAALAVEARQLEERAERTAAERQEVVRQHRDRVEAAAAVRHRLAEAESRLAAAAVEASCLSSRRTVAAEARDRLEARRRLDAAARQWDELLGTQGELRRQVVDLDQQAESLRTRHEEALAEARRCELLDERAVQRRRLVESRHGLDRAVARHQQAHRTLVEARARADAALSAFIDGAAPRLASSLRAGGPCPVCGSAVHPAPAVGPPGAVDHAAVEGAAAAAGRAERERAEAAVAVATLRRELGPMAGSDPTGLERRWEEAVAEAEQARSAGTRAVELERRRAELAERRRAVHERRTELDRRLEEVRQRRAELTGRLGSSIGLDPTQLARAAADADRAVAAAVAAGSEHQRLTQQRTTDIEQRDQLDAEVGRLAQTDARLEEQVRTHRERADGLRRQVAEAGGTDAPEELAEVAAAAVRSVAAARRAVAAGAAAEREAGHARRRRDQALVEAGFDDLDAALTAVHERDEIIRVERRVRDWDQQQVEVRAGLDALASHDLPDERPDLARLALAAAEAADEARRLVAVGGQASAHLDAVRQALHLVDDLARRTGDAQERARVVRTAAEVVRGRNRRNVTLEAWVLAAHLREVVAHANVHLRTMSAGRYQLQVSGAPADGRVRAGLDLEVDDAFTGRCRPTVSLSGGETFQAALSLALGLADVVTAGQAGLRLDALFIDEGFGSLDLDALDQAVDVLDSLRSRGAMVGVITHVESLKRALPAGLEVRRRADLAGSSVHQLG